MRGVGGEMRTSSRLLGSLVLFVIALAGPAPALALDYQAGSDPYQDIRAVPIPVELPSKTVLGQDFKFPAGVPLVKAFNITIEPGKKTALHKHAIPLLAYIVSGKLGVDYGSRGERSFSPGEAYIEAIEWCHIGYAIGDEPVEVLGFYLGQQNPDQIKPEPCDGKD